MYYSRRCVLSRKLTHTQAHPDLGPIVLEFGSTRANSDPFSGFGCVLKWTSDGEPKLSPLFKLHKKDLGNKRLKKDTYPGSLTFKNGSCPIIIRAVPVYICTRNRNLYPPPPSITTNPDLVNSLVCAHLIHLVQIRSQPAPISGVVASYTPFYAKRDAGDVRFTITDTHTQTELK